MKINLKQLREKENISQEYMAKQLGVSRPTYVQIEKGEKELTISQMRKLVELFGSDLKKIFLQQKTSESKAIPNATSRKKVNFQPDLEKFKEVILYITETVGAKPNIGETALFKFLYFIDFDFYEKYGKALTGLTYIKNHHGPTPKEFRKVVDEMMKSGEIEQIKSKYFQYNQRKYLPLRRPKLEKFTVAEIKHIDGILARLSDKNASDLSHYSHEDIPWQATPDQEIIDYDLVFQRFAPYAQRNYEEMMRNAAGQDILGELGPISEKEYKYYESI